MQGFPPLKISIFHVPKAKMRFFTGNHSKSGWIAAKHPVTQASYGVFWLGVLQVHQVLQSPGSHANISGPGTFWLLADA